MHILFRTDASASIGTGHVMRCLALAQALVRNGHKATFLSKELPDALKEKMTGAGCGVETLKAAPYGKEDAQETAKRGKGSWVIVDGYAFDGAYQDVLKQNGISVLFVDDYVHADHYAADIVLNQNVYATAEGYGKTSLLLGPRYALLRPEFAEIQPERIMLKRARNVLVTLGGADPDNVTGKVIRALRTIPKIRVTVVIGGANPHAEDIKTLCAEAGYEVANNTPDMRGLMALADVAIAGGGTTSYELARMGLPSLMLILADNQRAVAEGFEKAGVAKNLGWHADVSEEVIAKKASNLLNDGEARKAMSLAGKDLVDGYGALRVAQVLTGEPLWLRKALPQDYDRLFTWANDPTVRASSFSPDAISSGEHLRWFVRKIGDDKTILLIGIDKNEAPVGQIRFDIESDRAEIDVHTAPEHRGHGYGSALITQGIRILFKTAYGVNSVHAYAKEDNAASAGAFRKAGFTELEKEVRRGHSVYHFCRNRNET